MSKKSSTTLSQDSQGSEGSDRDNCDMTPDEWSRWMRDHFSSGINSARRTSSKELGDLASS